MSKLMIRGGYGEHGRSCFLVEYGTGCSGTGTDAWKQKKRSTRQVPRMYMVDCGILDTDPFPYPDVTPEELERVDYLFLTHCHKDHSGAFEYFLTRGFRGTLITTRMTCLLAGISYEKTEFLDVNEDDPVGLTRKIGPLTVSFGRNGHCPGGLWFEIFDGVDKILFSGDYQENTLVYVCDPIFGREAKLAIVDCAHRETEEDAEGLRTILVDTVGERLQEGRQVILPVPQYGRGLELLYLMNEKFPNLRVCVDRDFVTYAEKMLSESTWYYEESFELLKTRGFHVLDVEKAETGCSYDILLLADTHLKKQENVEFVNHAIEHHAAVLINGRVKENGPVGALLREGKAERFLFPHHQSHGDLMRVAKNNSFEVILPFHNNEKEVLL